jgi:hypothetical protein
VHSPVGFGDNDGEDKNFVDGGGEISNMLDVHQIISLGTLQFCFVVVDCERLLLVGDLNSEEVTVEYVWRHFGVMDVDVVDVQDVVVGDTNVSDAIVGDLDIGALLDGVSRFVTLPGLLIRQSSAGSEFLP